MSLHRARGNVVLMKQRTAWQPWFVSQLVTWVFGFAIGFTVAYFWVPLRDPVSQSDMRASAAVLKPGDDGTSMPETGARHDRLWPARHLFVAINGQWLAPGTQEFLRDVRPGGVVLREENMRSAVQTRALVAEITKAAGSWDGEPFIAVAHEGGQENVLRLAEAPSAAEIGMNLDEAWARETGKAYAEECVSRGIDVIFGPVLDVYESSTVFPSLSSRSFGSEPAEVTRYGLAMAEGLREGGVLSVAKHFPGYGAATYGPDGIQVVVKKDIPGLAKTMLPFNEAARQGVPGILVGHIAVPALDPEGKGRSAALSPVLVNQVLREKWGFEGVIIAEETALNPMTQSIPPERAVVEALIAGCDAVIFLDPNPERIRAACDEIRAAVKKGELPLAQLDQSKRRLNAWRSWLDRRDNLPVLPTDPAGVQLARSQAGEAELRARADEDARLKAEAEAKAKAEVEVRLKAEAKTKADEAERQRLAKVKEDARLKAVAEAKAEEEARLKAEADEEARLAAEAKVRADEEEQQRQAKAAEDARLKAETEAKAKSEEEARLKAEAEAKAKAEEEESRQQAKAAEEARIKSESEAKAKAEEAARLKAEAAQDLEPHKTETDATTRLAKVEDSSGTNERRVTTMFGLSELRHTVRPGETLGHVASIYDLDSTDIIRWNNLTDTDVEPGTELSLFMPPEQAEKFLSLSPEDSPDLQEIVHLVARGENLTLISEQYGTTVRDIVLWNKLDDSHLEPGQELTLFVAGQPKPEYITYRVGRGDTLREIAEEHKTSVGNLILVNGLKDPDHIWVGQPLKVPNN